MSRTPAATVQAGGGGEVGVRGWIAEPLTPETSPSRPPSQVLGVTARGSPSAGDPTPPRVLVRILPLATSSP